MVLAADCGQLACNLEPIRHLAATAIFPVRPVAENYDGAGLLLRLRSGANVRAVAPATVEDQARASISAENPPHFMMEPKLRATAQPARGKSDAQWGARRVARARQLSAAVKFCSANPEPLLQDVNAQHALHTHRRTPVACFRIIGLNQRGEFAPRHHPLHLLLEIAHAAPSWCTARTQSSSPVSVAL
jgi:hypothetical protein